MFAAINQDPWLAMLGVIAMVRLLIPTLGSMG